MRIAARRAVSRTLLSAALLALAGLALPGSAAAQGRMGYFNPESIQVHPIATLEVADRWYVAAVNTPDNSVEVYSTDETGGLLPFVVRVRTGMEPVSLLWVPELSRLYVACSLSDAVTEILLADDGSGLTATVERTDWVGDEPVALDYLPFEADDGEGGTVLRHTLVLAHREQDAWGWIDALTLQPIAPGVVLIDARVPKGDIDDDGMADDIALKAPRDVAVHCGRVWLLGEKGGNTAKFNFDLYSLPVTGGAARDLALANSANFGMAFAPDDDLFVVGGQALNTSRRDESVVAAAPTGFVVHTLTMVRGACGDAPQVKVRDINIEAFVQVEPQELPFVGPGPAGFGPIAAPAVVQPVFAPVPKSKALAQPTSVVVFDQPGGPRKVFLTAFGSDRVAVVEPNWSQNPKLWPLRRIAIPVVPGTSYPVSGPRGLALKPADSDALDDPGARLYVLDRLDNAITVIDPVGESKKGEFALRQDPTPQYIRDGRTFLYSAKHGNGFNACASCHFDARTDGLAWDLGDGQSPLIDPQLKDNLGITKTNFPADKQFMITQSLQGLLDFEVDPEIMTLFTNAPYHWRGDRADFAAFNPAFGGLLGGSPLDPPEVDAYVEFINSVQYPPNPRQPLNRVFSGTPFDADPPTVIPTSAQAGLFIFHTIVFDGPGSTCADCHTLPEGSDNKLSEQIQFDNPFDPTELLGAQPVEGSALRGLFQKEARLARFGSELPEDSAITGLEGMAHTGFLQKDPSMVGFDENRVGNLNAFVRTFFSQVICGAQNAFCQFLQDMNQFLQEFDWGAGPLVGLPYTVDLNNVGAGLTTTAFNLLEGAASAADSGMAVQVWESGSQRGFWFDPRRSRYVEEPAGAVLDRPGLIALLQGARDRLVLMGTPLGSELRVAAPSGQPSAPDPNPTPSGVTLLPMSPNTAYQGVPLLSTNWFNPAANTKGGFVSHRKRLAQLGILATAPPAENGFGVAVRWEPARRFLVAADGVELGAKLEIYTHDDPNATATPPPRNSTPENSPVVLRKMSLPIFPTGAVDPETELPIYETAAEMKPDEFLKLILGGDQAPSVSLAYTDSTFVLTESPLDPALAFDTDNWNWHFVRIVNPNGNQGDGGWQRLRLK